MTDRLAQCFSHLENNEESAAECIHCLKKLGEQVMFSRTEKRLVLGRESYDPAYSDKMKNLTKLLGISSLEDYERVDRNYNLTMY